MAKDRSKNHGIQRFRLASKIPNYLGSTLVSKPWTLFWFVCLFLPEYTILALRQDKTLEALPS